MFACVYLVITNLVSYRDMNKVRHYYRRRNWTIIMAFAIAILSIFVFLLTEDLTLDFVLLNKFSDVMIYMVLAVVLDLLSGMVWVEIEEEEE